MNELRQGFEKMSSPSPKVKDILRAKQQDTRKDFSTTWGDTVRDQQKALKISGREVFKTFYREHYEKDPPDLQECPQYDGPPPLDVKSYRETMIKSLHEKQQKDREHIHQEYQKLQHKIRNTPFLRLEEIADIYIKRSLVDECTMKDGIITRITKIRDIDEDLYESHLNVPKRVFTFFQLQRNLDRELGPEKPLALNASNILLHHLKEDLSLVPEDERKSFRLNQIDFAPVTSKEMKEVSNNFIFPSGKPFVHRYIEKEGRERTAFEALMTSKFGEIVLRALNDGHELLKRNECKKIVIIPQYRYHHLDYEPSWNYELDTWVYNKNIWAHERETGEDTKIDGPLEHISYHLK